MTLEAAISSIRSRSGLGQIEFGKLLGVAHSMVGRYEKGDRKPGEMTLLRLLDMANEPEQEPILARLREFAGKRGAPDATDAVAEALRLSGRAKVLRESMDVEAARRLNAALGQPTEKELAFLSEMLDCYRECDEEMLFELHSTARTFLRIARRRSGQKKQVDRERDSA